MIIVIKAAQLSKRQGGPKQFAPVHSVKLIIQSSDRFVEVISIIPGFAKTNKQTKINLLS